MTAYNKYIIMMCWCEICQLSFMCIEVCILQHGMDEQSLEALVYPLCCMIFRNVDLVSYLYLVTFVSIIV